MEVIYGVQSSYSKGLDECRPWAQVSRNLLGLLLDFQARTAACMNTWAIRGLKDSRGQRYLSLRLTRAITGDRAQGSRPLRAPAQKGGSRSSWKPGGSSEALGRGLGAWPDSSELILGRAVMGAGCPLPHPAHFPLGCKKAVR